VHRYAADLNRYPTDVDASSVENAPEAAGKFPHGFHWVKSTLGEPVLKHPISQTIHERIVSRYHDRFHDLVAQRLKSIREIHGIAPIYHLDLHSMPSRGTGSHADQGRTRAEVVLSDFDGKSCEPAFMNLTVHAFRDAGFEVAVNWPYKGGRITQRYGRPDSGHHTLQIELNRSLYMDEATRERLPIKFEELQLQLGVALSRVLKELKRGAI
jgi:N-formylglutamate amidohydrolase